jgi:hypothetical protein
MIRVIEAAQLIARIRDPELYQAMSCFVSDVRDILLEMDRILGAPVPQQDDINHIRSRARVLLSFEPDKNR